MSFGVKNPSADGKEAMKDKEQKGGSGVSTTEKAQNTWDQMKGAVSNETNKTKDNLTSMKDDPKESSKGLMKQLESAPSSFYLYATMGSIGASAVLRIMGKKDFATFVGQWPPTFLSLALLSKLLKPSKDMR